MKYRNLLADILDEYREFYWASYKRLKQNIKDLPKGSFQKKKIKEGVYYYLNWRDGKDKKWKYVGKRIPSELKKQIEERKKFQEQLQVVKENLYTLGLGGRISGTINRFKIFERDNFTCQYCGRSPRKHGVVLHLDHKIPKRRGGTDKEDNLITACAQCNAEKHDFIMFNE